MMQPLGPDYAGFLEDFIPSIDNIPLEVQHVMSELLAKDTEYHNIVDNVRVLDQELRKTMTEGKDVEAKEAQKLDVGTKDYQKIGRIHVEDDEGQLAKYEEIEQQFDSMGHIIQEKIGMSERVRDMVDRHLKRLISEMDKLEETDPTVYDPIPVTPEPRFRLTERKKVPSSRLVPREKRRKSELSISVLGADDTPYCYCREPSFGEMIGCDNAQCKTEWFHLECVGLTEPPKGVWYCKECSALRKKKSTYD